MIKNKRTNKSAWSRRNHTGGFTLIELLVVIAIIAVLASILFPVFARARENARRTSCQSNMKQIGLAFMQYSQDYDEMMPHGFGDNDATPGAGATQNLPYGWADQVQPYLKSIQVLQCPSERWPQKSDPTSGGGINRVGYTDYAWNNVLRIQVVGVIYRGTQLSEFTFASNTAMVQDSLSGNFICCNSSNARHGASEELLDGSDSSTTNYREPRHLEGNNFLFADGHVKWLKPGKVSPAVGPAPGYAKYCSSKTVVGVNRPTGSNFTFCSS